MIRRILWSLLGLFVLLCAAVVVLGTTTWGARFVLARVGGAMSGQLTYASVQGSLAGPLRIRGLEYRTGTRDTRVNDVELNWSPLALFSGTLDVKRLHIQGVRVTSLRPAAPSAGGLPNLHVLLVFVVGTVLMRSAGCAINDFADRVFDPQVARTRDRPVAAGRRSVSRSRLAPWVPGPHPRSGRPGPA